MLVYGFKLLLAAAPVLLGASVAMGDDWASVVRLPEVGSPFSPAMTSATPDLLPPAYDPAVRPATAMSPLAPALTADPAVEAPPADLPADATAVPAITPDPVQTPAAAEPPCQWAGYEKGFFIQTCDGNYSFKLQGGMQLRYNANWRDEPLVEGAYDAFEDGFTINRAWLIFSGNLISPDLNYSMRLNLNSQGDEFVEDARLFYTFDDTWMIMGGRFLNPAFLRETNVSYMRQLAIDRSYVEALFTLGYTDCVVLTRQTDCTMTQFVVSDGRGSGGKGVNTDFPNDSADIALTAGLDWKLFGEWEQYGDFTSWEDQDWGLFLGSGFHWEEGETGDDEAVNNLNNFGSWTVDVTLEGRGFSFFVAGVGRHSRNEESLDQYALMAQSGYQLVPEKWEPYVRYEYICLDGMTNVGSTGVPVADSNISLFTLGVNRYFARHAAKVTSEVIYAADPLPVRATGVGLLEDPLAQDGQVAFRTQVQVYF